MDIKKFKWMVNKILGFRGFVRGLQVLATLSSSRTDSFLADARTVKNELATWVALMHTCQFDARRSRHIMAGIVGRHRDIDMDEMPHPDEAQLKSMGPLVWLVHQQQEHFEKGTVGHNAAMMLQLALFRSIHPTVTVEEMARAVREEFDAQMEDACALPLLVEAPELVVPDPVEFS